MRHLLALLAVVPLMALAQDAPSLASLKDKNRVLLVFAPSDRNPEFKQQFDMLFRHAAEMQQRHLFVISVVVSTGIDPGANTLRVQHPPVASNTDQIDLRHRFHVAPGQFEVILVGKDGGEKLRQNKPISAQKLQATVDSMPMRQREMRERQNP